MTREEAIKKIKEYLIQNGGATKVEAEIAFTSKSPMDGCLLMLEALELIKFDGPDK